MKKEKTGMSKTIEKGTRIKSRKDRRKRAWDDQNIYKQHQKRKREQKKKKKRNPTFNSITKIITTSNKRRSLLFMFATMHRRRFRLPQLLPVQQVPHQA